MINAGSAFYLEVNLTPSADGLKTSKKQIITLLPLYYQKYCYCYCYHHHESVVNLSTSSIIRERPTVCPNGASRLGKCARADAAC